MVYYYNKCKTGTLLLFYATPAYIYIISCFLIETIIVSFLNLMASFNSNFIIKERFFSMKMKRWHIN